MAIESQDYDEMHWLERKELREAYVKEQKGNCYHCKAPLGGEPAPEVVRQGESVDWSLFPPNFTKYPVHLHHDHGTGMTIGAVHSLCNAVLWQYRGE